MKIRAVIAACACAVMVSAAVKKSAAQVIPVQQFAFSTGTLTADNARWNVYYSGNVAERIPGAMGYSGLGQQLSAAGYLGSRFTLLASASMGIPAGGRMQSMLQAEVLRDLLGGYNNNGFRLGIGAGLGKNWANRADIFSRITASYNTAAWRMTANGKVDKAFQQHADKADVMVSVGVQRSAGKNVYLGIEGMGEDLEGLWEQDEAEGGAKVMLGPAVHYAPAAGKLSFLLAGGPVFYATRSRVVTVGEVRDLLPAAHNGYIIRAMVFYSFR